MLTKTEYDAARIYELETQNAKLRAELEAAHQRERKLSAALGSEREHSEWLQGECNKAVDDMLWANGKKAKATALVAELQRELEQVKATLWTANEATVMMGESLAESRKLAAELQCENERLKDELSEATAEIVELTAHLTNARRFANAFGSKWAIACAELEAARKVADAAVAVGIAGSARIHVGALLSGGLAHLEAIRLLFEAQLHAMEAQADAVREYRARAESNGRENKTNDD